MSLFDNKITKTKKLEVGDTVFLGLYLQEGEVPTKVEWKVINIENGKALLISKYALITSEYCDTDKKSYSQLEWENSLAREKCRQFFDECFSKSEQSFIIEKKTEKNGTGKDCFDYVFILSEDEANLFLSETETRKCKPTLKAKADGARMGWTDDTRDCVSWWIMPEFAYGEIYPKAVFQTGEIAFHSRNAYHQDFCIRPSILVDIEKIQIND